MKKLIPIFLCILVLTGCHQRNFTPVLTTDFSRNAVCKIGDFSFDCKITKIEKCISLEVLSTRAKGLTVTYSNGEITFSKGNITKTFKADNIDSTNPTKILYSVFDNLEELEVKRVENHFEYVGKTAIGEFKIVQNKDNSIKSISVPSADLTIEFVDE